MMDILEVDEVTEEGEQDRNKWRWTVGEARRRRK